MCLRGFTGVGFDWGCAVGRVECLLLLVASSLASAGRQISCMKIVVLGLVFMAFVCPARSA